MKKLILAVASTIFILSNGAAMAQAAVPPAAQTLSALEQEIGGLQTEWAHIKYEVSDENAQKTQMQALSQKAASVTARYPDKAEPKIWEAIIVSSQAGLKGGFGALGLVKHARDLLLEALKIDPAALQGSAYTSLGSLYYQVPRWPIGFGDKGKAQAYLEQARAINPTGIDPNFFYGDYLIEQGEYAKAIPVLQQALQAPPRPNRQVADAGRRKEIQEAIAKAQKKLDN